jgi:glycosyltransferase involved in cell wall biosynthesis
MLVHFPNLRLNFAVTGQRLPISVCIIAGNEAHRIRRALAGVAGWTNEIIVVLNEEVSDGTDKIAESFGANVFREPWKGHVAQKNSAVDKATQPWIFGLDADEEVSAALRDEIIRAVTRAETNSGYAGYSLPRCTFYCGRWIRHGDWYPDRKVRLCRRGRAEWSGVDPHDAMIVNGRVGRLKHDLLHYSMENLEHHARKTNDYSNMFARRHGESGRRASLVEMWFRPWWRFVRGYFLRLGFLDGWRGYVIARMIAFETFLRYAKVREAQLPPAGNSGGPPA